MFGGPQRQRCVATLKRGQRLFAAAIAVMLLAGQIVAVLHFMLVPHAIDPRTGKVVHRCDFYPHPSEHKSTRSLDDTTPDDDDPVQHECRVYSCLHQAKILTATPSMVLSSSIVLLSAPPVKETVFHSCFRVYMVSPANSPPAFGLS